MFQPMLNNQVQLLNIKVRRVSPGFRRSNTKTLGILERGVFG
jgi:hypothetical protein